MLAAPSPRITAFVPTMGALHAGHATLIQHAAQLAPHVVVSIFVNPLQFGANEDYHRYPRTLEADSALAQHHGATEIFAPETTQLYGENFATTIEVGAMGDVLEGAMRPKHFNGVATVVVKLLQRVQPQFMLLGEKDFQQLCVLQQVIRDLDMNVQVVPVPTIREETGLALSSRNRYLSPHARQQIAPTLYQVLCQVRDHTIKPSQAIEILLHQGFSQVDYLELWQNRWVAAARLEGVRLLDNVPCT